MKAIEFNDDHNGLATEKFNEWAKNKSLNRNVIVHTHEAYNESIGELTTTIIVIWDEVQLPNW